jgi:molybdopterin-containing oxidoreductase family membrane subunit
VFNNLGLMFLAFAMLWSYFTFAEHLTVWYGNEHAERIVFDARIDGRFSGYFWTMIVVNTVIPFLILPFRWGRKPLGTAIVGFGVLIGMWIERYLIVVGTLSFPRLTYTEGFYSPTWVEVGILIGSVGLFGFLYFSFIQLAPIVSLWEVREGEHIKHRVEPAHPSALHPAPQLAKEEA